jgi:hypothetical protein
MLQDAPSGPSKKAGCGGNEPSQADDPEFELECICGRFDKDRLLVRWVDYAGEFVQEEGLVKR